jgi:hypothetical protein
MPATAARKRPVPGHVEPDHRNVERIAGITLMSPRPAPIHAKVSFALCAVLAAPFDDHHRSKGRGRPSRGPGGWQILAEPELHLRADILIPDVAGWRTERLPTLPRTAYIAVTPDWVCEILSPSTQNIDRHSKLPAYAAAGVQTVWLISERARTLEVFRLGKKSHEHVATHSGDARVRVEPFPELRLDLVSLWP